ncbi:MAG: EAL domain-containing protein [Anaerolineales bacterium]|nr:EAL domain-containing protein [Anaerolineales bacterium]
MHRILWRQLKRLQLDPTSPPPDGDWERFLTHIDQTYKQADQDRYLLERSLAISSKETQELYDQERRRVQEALRVSEGKYRTLFEHAVDSIFIIDVETRKILDVNQVAADRLGYTREQLQHMTIDDIYPPNELARNPEIVQKIHESGHLTFERIHIRKDGSTMPVEVSSTITEQDGRRVYQSIARDITQRKLAEEELQRLANYDSLTGVANRFLFIDRVSQAIQAARREGAMLAVLFLDLDGFKAINDAFGHKHGDTLLQVMARRIIQNVRKGDTVARLGGDEFAILMEGIHSAAEVEPVVQKIVASVSQPFVFQEIEAFITCSAGVSIFPADGEDPDTLIQNADRAMYASKSDGKSNYRFFAATMKTQALERLELGNYLRNALEQQQFFALYQVQLNSETGQVFGVEALARWNHPLLGVLPADNFIDVAEEMGLILPLSDWMLETACSQARQWLEQGVRPVRLAINLSARDLNDANLTQRIESLLARTGFPAELLELELSENTVFRDLDAAEQTLIALKSLGLRLAIDDFGTGYSTLSQLARFPFDTLKIDRRFAPQISTSVAHKAILSGIVTIARNLEIELVAEGVENREQLEFYKDAGCFNFQGKFFSDPEPPDGVVELIRSGFPAKS